MYEPVWSVNWAILKITERIGNLAIVYEEHNPTSPIFDLI